MMGLRTWIVALLVPLCWAHLQQKCGPPRLLHNWPNVTASSGAKVFITCPLDPENTCLVDFVEWYKHESNPEWSHPTSSRRRLRPGHDNVQVFAFDPFMLFFEQVGTQDEGWFSCAIGNAEGRDEMATFLSVLPPSRGSNLRKEAKTMSLTSSHPSGSSRGSPNVDRTQDLSRQSAAAAPVRASSPSNAPAAVMYGSSRYSWVSPGQSASNPASTAAPEHVPDSGHGTILARMDQLGQSSDSDGHSRSSEATGYEHEVNMRQRMDAVYDHLRYIYKRLEDVLARLDKLEARQPPFHHQK